MTGTIFSEKRSLGFALVMRWAQGSAAQPRDISALKNETGRTAACIFICHIDILDPDGYERNAKDSAFVRDWSKVGVKRDRGQWATGEELGSKRAISLFKKATRP